MRWLLPLLFLLGACSSLPRHDGWLPTLTTGHQVSVEGWVRWRGEIRLYRSEVELNERQAKFPICISGVAPGYSEEAQKKMDGHRVRVDAEVVEYAEVEPKQPTPGYFSDYKMLDGELLANWCFGTHILKITSIEVVD